jgi:hypothetical protein
MDPTNPTFYRLPARLLETGMSTDDGQDILTVSPGEGWVLACVYTPRSDDPQQDEVNRGETECRMYKLDEQVDLAVFADTLTDGSGYPDAEPVPSSGARATPAAGLDAAANRDGAEPVVPVDAGAAQGTGG